LTIIAVNVKGRLYCTKKKLIDVPINMKRLKRLRAIYEVKGVNGPSSALHPSFFLKGPFSKMQGLLRRGIKECFVLFAQYVLWTDY